MAGSNPVSAILIIIITIFLPPVGVFMIAGCGADLLINILLTCLGYFPGHIHAFYLEYVYFERRDQARLGQINQSHAPGIYSQNVQRGNVAGYGTVAT
ncbi:hypothetical protein MMC26_004771 [Xylographa opegraphella]|nr:hypothetical protein [Xylographa opegraphella]